MTAAAVTMVWNDAWFLRRWLAYFAPRLGARNLHVFAHGGEPEILALCGDVNVTVLPRDRVTVEFDNDRWAFLSHVTSGLTRFYDTVICLDVDELLIPTTPERDLGAILNALPRGRIWAVPGFELFAPETDATEIADHDPIARTCTSAMFSPNYSKTCIAGRAVRFTSGGHGLYDEPPEILTDLALMHLRFVNPAERLRRNALRIQIAAEAYRTATETRKELRATGRLGSWRQVAGRHDAMFEQFAQTPEVDWQTGFPQIAAQLPRLRQIRQDQHSFFGSNPDPALRLHLPDFARALF